MTNDWFYINDLTKALEFLLSENKRADREKKVLADTCCPSKRAILSESVNEEDGNLVFRYVVPGVKKDEIKVWTEDWKLNVEVRDEKLNHDIADIAKGIQKDINPDPVEVSLDLGILTVKFSLNVDEKLKRHDYEIR